MKKLIGLALVIGLVAAPWGVAQGKVQASKATTVWEDPSGDTQVNAQPVPGLDQVGLDIVSGQIERKGKDLVFTVNHSAMPPIGTIPETFRFLWGFSVDGKSYRLTVKSADIGKPDLGQNETSERVGRVDATGHFRLEGDCTATPAPALTTFVNCKPLAYLTGTWDPAGKSFSMVVPMSAVKAKPGSVLQSGTGTAIQICPICWVSHVAERSLSTTIIDTAFWAGKWKVPR